VQACGGGGDASPLPTIEHRPHLRSDVQVCRGDGNVSS
jgi:hypothetical protein